MDISNQRGYWRRSILIPLWVQQLLIQFGGLIAFSMIISAFWHGLPIGHGGDGDWNERAILLVFLLLYTTLITATLFEIVLYIISRLHSQLYYQIQVAKTGTSAVIWIVLFFYPFVVRDARRQPVAATITLSLITFFVQIPLISALIHAWLARRDDDQRIYEYVQDEVLPGAQDAVSVDLDIEPSESTPLLSRSS